MASSRSKAHPKHGIGVSAEGPSDESLLERYLECEELESHEAFRILVVRHGPMVLGVCRQVLDDEADAEDAFQATFLMLARKGASIRNRRILSGWLHEVAYRIASRARINEVNRSILERQVMANLPRTTADDDPQETAIWNELRPILHQEVNWLPEKFRTLVVLSYLEGKTNEEVAELLQCPVGTVKGRLSRAREMLRKRLLRRGLVLSAPFLMTALSRGIVFAEVVPAELINRTLMTIGTLGRRSGPVIRGSSSAQPSAETSIATSIVSLANAHGEGLGFGYLRYPVLLTILLISMAIGINLALGSDADSAYLRTALSALNPWQPAGSACH